MIILKQVEENVNSDSFTTIVLLSAVAFMTVDLSSGLEFDISASEESMQSPTVSSSISSLSFSVWKSESTVTEQNERLKRGI